MRFAVESWDPAYGSAIESLDLEPSTEDVDAAIEADLDSWSPVPALVASQEQDGTPIWFVDGVRRIDARVWIELDTSSAKPGVCASVAAGAVRVAEGTAEIIDVKVERGLYTTPEATGPIATRAGTYVLVASTGTEVEDIYYAIHRHMTELESRVTTAAGPDDIVVVDGPLRGRSGDRVIGYVKTQHKQYLLPAQQRVLGQLDAGERTPVFLLGGHQTRYSWYLRLPGPRAHALSGIVRCEMPAHGEVGAAADCAQRLGARLVHFASEPHKDSRAPQNLYPIAGLERQLRHRLGDAQMQERALRLASRSTSPA